MPSIIPGFEYDIFISYRQKDNKGDKWVSEFVNALKTELESTLKDDLSIYFDENQHDGLLETHDVNASLKDKLRCLIFIPVISRTYCDPRSFAWTHEFTAFVEEATHDRYGLKIKLPNGNVANRVLPVRIHDINPSDLKICEETLGGMLRPIDFIYRSQGVNRPLRINEDHPHDNLSKIYYRDQINKTANAIDEIIHSLKSFQLPESSEIQGKDEPVNLDDPKLFEGITLPPKKLSYQNLKKYIYTLLVLAPVLALVLGWHGLTRLAGPGKAKREQAMEHALNATQLCDNGQLEGAKREAALALSIDPRNSSALTTMAAVSFKQGDIPKAIEFTLEALKANPGNSTAAYNLAYSFDESGDVQQATEWYSKSIAIDSAQVPAYSALGRLYNKQKNTADAVLILSLAEKKYPDSKYIYAVHKNLGNSYLLLDQTASAIRYLELSVAEKPDEPETNLYLAQCYEASGDMIKSIEYWQKYISLEPDSVKSGDAQKHLKEITVRHLKEILK